MENASGDQRAQLEIIQHSAQHLELFLAAGVDFIALDFTNGIYYGEVLSNLLDIYLAYQTAGWDVVWLSLIKFLYSSKVKYLPSTSLNKANLAARS